MREITPGKCIFAGGALLDDAFLDLVKRKVERVCPRPTFEALTEKDFDMFVENIWPTGLKVFHSATFEARSFHLPAKFLRSRARRNPAANTGSVLITFTP